MSYVISSEVDIDADAATVWGVLVDFPRYGEWSNFSRATGMAEVGTRLAMRMPGFAFRPTVTIVEPGRQLRWSGTLLSERIFVGSHSFVLTANPDGTTHLLNHERFAGGLTTLLGRFSTQSGDNGYSAFNAGLKRQAESLSGGHHLNLSQEHARPSSSIPDTTTAVFLPGLVEPDGLEVKTVPVAAPGDGQLLVAVEATGISYAEQAMRRGRYYGQPPFPFTPGYDLVGTVLAAGSPEDTALVGQRVATMTKTGAWTGHAVVEARDSVRVPDGIAPEDAETVVVNGVTAWQMLHRSARVQPGATILVFGANGGVGGILIQLAQHHGVHVIGAASSRHHDALRAQGVEPVDYGDPRLAERVRELAPRGLDAVFDNVGGATTRTAWSLLAPGGALVSYAIIEAASGTGGLMVPFLKAVAQAQLRNALPNGRRASFYDLWAGHKVRPTRFRRHLEEDLARVFALLADGAITSNIAARFPLEDARAAFTLAESRTLSGKVVLLP